MAGEGTPLLSDVPQSVKREISYQRYSPARKRFIVAIVSWCGLMPLLISGTFYPSIPQIAKDLNSTGQVISLAVSLSVFSASIGASCTVAYSTFYGRRPVYLLALPVSIIGSIGVASAQGIPELMFWRFWQAAGASPGFAVGAGVIGDIYQLEERGTAIGVFSSAILLGPTLAPPIGGFAAHYASWRVMQLLLGLFCLIAFVIVYLTFPETSRPGERGVDKLRQLEPGNRKFVFINPLSPWGLLRSPNILIVSVAAFLVLLTDYVLLVPMAYTIGDRYNIHNEALLGACFLPCGLGNMIGAPISGWMSDKIIVRWRERRGGILYPEDRLRATLVSALTLVPLSVLACGLFTKYIEGPVGLTLNLIALLCNGIGVNVVLSPCVAYIVDVMHTRSADAVACYSGFRSFLLSFAIAGVLPMVNTYGQLITNTLSATLAWIGFLLLWLTIRYGEKMRNWVDVGFSTADNN